jgi:uncharacterized protein YecE (DUF72 family)
MSVRIGTSGWRYQGWRGTFYPPGLPERAQLAHLSQCFDSVELNGSFYALQSPECYRRWYAETPDDFVFAVKGSRFITHMKKLRDVESALANFLASGLLALEHKLGPLLWQFPERLAFDRRFADFFELLPKDTLEAARLARRHDRALVPNALTDVSSRRPLRHAVELRHASFGCSEFMDLLRQHDVAWVVADSAGRWPCIEEVTADFAYVRLHGHTELYSGRYTDEALAYWAERVRRWSSGMAVTKAAAPDGGLPRRKRRDVYVYFDNDAKVHAPYDALRLSRLLGLRTRRTAKPASVSTRARR